MHLPELPTVFVKGGEERKAFFTVQARELLASGWVVKGSEKKVEEPAPEVKEEPVAEAEEVIVAEETPKPKPRTRTRTKKVTEE